MRDRGAQNSTHTRPGFDVCCPIVTEGVTTGEKWEKGTGDLALPTPCETTVISKPPGENANSWAMSQKIPHCQSERGPDSLTRNRSFGSSDVVHSEPTLEDCWPRLSDNATTRMSWNSRTLRAIC